MTQAATQMKTRTSERTAADGAIRLTDHATLMPDPGRDARPAWLKSIAEQAMTRFAALGLPTPRDEEWRLTRIKPIAEASYRAAEPADAEPLTAREIERFAIRDMTCSCLVFVNGMYVPALSSLRALPKGAVVQTLAEVMASNESLVRPHLAQHAPFEHDAFTALNTASFADGAFVYVPEGATVDDPIHVLNIAVAGSGPVIAHPRNLIVAGAKGNVTVVEDYVALNGSDDVYFNNAVTEIVVGAEARVAHYLMERESAKAFNIQTLRIQQEESSDFASHSLMTGGSIVRNNVNPRLNGEDCHSLLNGLYLTRESQHIDNHMRVEHGSPNCDSRQYYKGILNDKSTTIFSGRIIVDQIAQRTDAIQNNQNLLLSDDCRANAHPQLEIYADDVRCTHGATIGELDDEAIFYLQSRGLNESAARGVLVYAFAQESLDRIGVEPIRRHMEAVLFDRLPHGELLRKITA